MVNFQNIYEEVVSILLSKENIYYSDMWVEEKNILRLSNTLNWNIYTHN